MTDKPQTHSYSTSSSGIARNADEELTAATEQLFLNIASASGNEMVRQGVLSINDEMRNIRPYEATFIPDRLAEYQALADCWRRRDWETLRARLIEYHQRRQDLAPQIIALIDRPN